MSPKYCRNCGSPLRAGVKFCSQCGKSYVVQASTDFKHPPIETNIARNEKKTTIIAQLIIKK